MQLYIPGTKDFWRLFSGKMIDYLGYLYSLLIAGGGVAGYLMSGSLMSLMMGLIFGGLATLGAYRISAREDRFVVGLLVSLAMLGRFGQAYLKTGQLWPAAVVALASAVVFLRYLASAYSYYMKTQQ